MKKIISFTLAIVMLVGIFAVGTVSASAEVTQQTYTHRFSSEESDWNEPLVISSLTKLTISVNLPVYDNGTTGMYSFEVADATGKTWLSGLEDGPKPGYNYYAYLPAGAYTIKYYAYYTSQHEFTDAVYKITAESNWAVPTPQISQTVKTTKYSTYTQYNTSFVWDQKDALGNFKYQRDYSGVEIYSKSDNEDWKLSKIAPNGFLYNYGYSLTFYNNSFIHYYKVRAYKELGNGEKIYSGFSNVLSAQTDYKPAAPKINSAKTVKKKKQVTLTWGKVGPAKGYVVYRSTKKDKGFKKVVTTKKTKYTNKKLKLKKTYYYKVKSYAVINGIKIFSNYSSAKKVIIK